MVSTWMNKAQEASRGMTRTPLKSGSNPNANDNAGKPLGFGAVLFSSVEKAAAPAVDFFSWEAPASQQEALLA